MAVEFENKKPALRMMVVVTNPKLGQRALELFREGHIPMQHQFYGEGTASSEIMDMLGLGTMERVAILSMAPKPFADEMLKKLRKHLRLGSVNSGVAFTVPLSGGSARMIRLIETLRPEKRDELLERTEKEMAESEYTMILAIVDQGYSEEVMSAARGAGATGGTVFRSRRVGSEEASRFWGITVQQEREIVLILAQKENKVAIMKAIGESCGMQTPAHGVAVSLPVDGVAGLD